MPRYTPDGVEAATAHDLANPFVWFFDEPDLDDPRWQLGYDRHRQTLLADAREKSRRPHHWGTRPWSYWVFEHGHGRFGGDQQNTLRLLIEDDELQDFEVEQIRELAAEARARVGTPDEYYCTKPCVGPDADAVALGDLLEELIR